MSSVCSWCCLWVGLLSVGELVSELDTCVGGGGSGRVLVVLGRSPCRRGINYDVLVFVGGVL